MHPLPQRNPIWSRPHPGAHAKAPMQSSAGHQNGPYGHGGSNSIHVKSDDKKMISFSILCATGEIGRVIGKGGDNIRDLELRTGAKIHVEDTAPKSEECVIRVTAKEAPWVPISPTVQAVLQLQDRINATCGKSIITTRLLVPSCHMGCIIGPAGYIIREIKKRTGASIRFYSKDDKPKYASDSEGLLQISGNLTDAKSALSEIASRLRAKALGTRNVAVNPAPSGLVDEFTLSGNLPGRGLPSDGMSGAGNTVRCEHLKDKSIKSPTSNIAHKSKVPRSDTSLSCGVHISLGKSQMHAKKSEGKDTEGYIFQSQLESSQPCKKSKKGETIEDDVQLLDRSVMAGTEISSTMKTGYDGATPILEERPSYRSPTSLTDYHCSTDSLERKNGGSLDIVTDHPLNTFSGETNDGLPLTTKHGEELLALTEEELTELGGKVPCDVGLRQLKESEATDETYIEGHHDSQIKATTHGVTCIKSLETGGLLNVIETSESPQNRIEPSYSGEEFSKTGDKPSENPTKTPDLLSTVEFEQFEGDSQQRKNPQHQLHQCDFLPSKNKILHQCEGPNDSGGQLKAGEKRKGQGRKKSRPQKVRVINKLASFEGHELKQLDENDDAELREHTGDKVGLSVIISPSNFSPEIHLHSHGDKERSDEDTPILKYDDSVGDRQHNRVMGEQHREQLDKNVLGELSTQGYHVSELEAIDQGDTHFMGSEAIESLHTMEASSGAKLVEISYSDIGQSEAAAREAQNEVLHPTPGDQVIGPPLVPSSTKESNFPFEKQSSLWESIAAIKVFSAMPQQPHFCPLEEYCKEFREGMAIGLMVTFSNLVDGIDKLQVSDSWVEFDGKLKTLVLLERHGFDVQRVRARLEELQRMKSHLEQLAEKRSALKVLVFEKQKERDRLNAEVEQIDKTVVGLEQLASHFFKKKSLVLKQKEDNEARMVKLQMDTREAEDAARSAEYEFEAAVAAAL